MPTLRERLLSQSESRTSPPKTGSLRQRLLAQSPEPAVIPSQLEVTKDDMRPSGFFETMRHEFKEGLNLAREAGEQLSTNKVGMFGTSITPTVLGGIGAAQAALSPLLGLSQKSGELTQDFVTANLGTNFKKNYPKIAREIGVAAAVGVNMATLFAFPAKGIFRGVRQAGKGLKDILATAGGYRGKYEAFVDKVGEAFKVGVKKLGGETLLAGRGTPKEFREANAHRLAVEQNTIEDALNLGTRLKRELTRSERLRVDQILRGSISTASKSEGAATKLGASQAKTDPLAREARAQLDDMQQKLIEGEVLTPEIVERFQGFFGPYLTRRYASKEFVRTGGVLTRVRPLRQGQDPDLLERGTRLDIVIPDLNKELKAMDALVSKTGFKAEFQAALNAIKKFTKTEATQSTTTVVGGAKVAAGGKATLATSGPIAKLEEVMAGALEVRGMQRGEAQNFLLKLKEAGVKQAKGEDGQDTETTTTIIETLKETIDIDEATEVALKMFNAITTRFALKGGKTVMVNGRKFRIKPTSNPESGLERADALDSLLRAGFKVESRNGRRVKLFRDIPDTVQKEMGVIRDQPGFLVASSLSRSGRELATRNFFKTVSENPMWTVQPGMKVPPGFVQMPDDLKGLGKLSGKFMRADMADEINAFVKLPGEFMRVMERLTTLWKIGKVMNPGTMARNFMSSTVLADFGGLAPWKADGIKAYTTAIMGYAGKSTEGATLIHQARRLGLFRAGFNEQEIKLLADGFLKSKDSNAMIRMLDGLRNVAEKTGVEKVSRLYGAIDEFFKSSLFIHARQRGLDPATALRHAKKFGIDYQDISPAVRFLRKVPFGAPFATFASKAIPLSIETAIKHPIRFWKYLALIGAVGETTRQTLELDRRQLEGIREIAQVRSPRFALIDKDKEGRFEFLDLGYILPFGDLLEGLDVLRGGTGASFSFLPPGGPAMSLMEAGLNRNMFNKQPIYNLESDTTFQVAAKVNNHIFKSWFPAWTPPIPGTGFPGGFTTEAFRKVLAPTFQIPGEQPLSPTDFLGRQSTPGSVAAAKLGGINVKKVSLEDSVRLFDLRVGRKMRALSQKMSKILNSGVSKPQKEMELVKIQRQQQVVLDEATELHAKLTGIPTLGHTTPRGSLKERLLAQ